MTSITVDRNGFIVNHLLSRKGPCRVATTANITLSGIQVIDGVTVEAEDRILVRSQTNGLNAIYIAKTGDWELADDFDQRGHVVKGTKVFVTDGSSNGVTEWYVTTEGRPWPGRETITFTRLDTADLTAHIADTSDAHDASAISVTPAGGIVATDVQAAIVELDTEKEPADSAILKSDESENLTVGYTATAENIGTISSGTVTPNPATGNLKRYVNNGAHTLAPPSATGDYTIVIQVTNGASAGATTTSGFTKVTGSSLTTTNGDDFLFFITKLNGFTHLHAVALQ